MPASRSEFNELTPSQKVEQLNHSIEQQNAKFLQAEAISLESLRAIVNADVTDRQQDDFYDLLTVYEPALFDNLAVAERQARDDVLQKETESEYLSREVEEKLADLKRSVELAVSLAPRRKDELEKAAEEESAKIQASLSVLAINHATAHLNSIHAQQEEVGIAWTIPQAIAPEDRMTLFELMEEERLKKSEGSVEYIQTDTIPVTPDERVHQAEVAEKARRAVMNPNASNYITYYLAEAVGEVVTVEELDSFLYVADVDRHRSHITTLLGPKIQGKRIQKLLADDYGLVLQYGFRRVQRSVDDRLVEHSRTRIYRAIDPSSTTELESVITRVQSNDDVVADEFEPIEVPAVLPPIPTEEATPVHGIEEPQLEENDDVAPEHKTDWTEEFAQAIDGAIDRLIADGLFDDDMMRGVEIRTKSSSNIFGTETMRKRLHSSGLMRLGEVRRDEMNREQRVLGALYNAHKHILGERKKRKEALTLINEQIEIRLTELRSTEE